MIASQPMRCGTSVGANYEEADESVYWMELIVESGIIPRERLGDLIQEANEILAMVVASIRTSRVGAQKSNSRRSPQP